MTVKLINAEEIQKELELAGWLAKISTDNENAGNEKVAKFCIESGHLTPTRAMRFIFEIDCSRAASHELVRHSVGIGLVQRSQRYVKEDNFAYVVPGSINTKDALVEIPIWDCTTGELRGRQYTIFDFEDIQDIIRQWYNGVIDKGVKPEDARYALTNATVTKIRCSFTWEALQNFCSKRRCNRAQWEIQNIANLMAYLVSQVNQYLGDRLKPKCELTGYCTEKQCCGKTPKKEEVLGIYNKWKRGEIK